MKFRKKPVIIEATRISEKIEIATREGTLYGYPGEWLITGIQGEKYPCGDEIFRGSYEMIDGTEIPPDKKEASKNVK